MTRRISFGQGSTEFKAEMPPDVKRFFKRATRDALEKAGHLELESIHIITKNEKKLQSPEFINAIRNNRKIYFDKEGNIYASKPQNTKTFSYRMYFMPNGLLFPDDLFKHLKEDWEKARDIVTLLTSYYNEPLWD